MSAMIAQRARVWPAPASRFPVPTACLLLLAATNAVVGCSSATVTPTAPAGRPPRPNLVLIVVDDIGFADLGFQGSRDIHTPHMDRLAANGARLTNGYVPHPFCSPSRAGLLTGRYPQRFGHENNPSFLPQDSTVGLPPEEQTLAEALQRVGYVTGAVGKWHLGAAPPFHPNRRGFDEFFGFLGGGHDYFDTTGDAQQEYLSPLQRNGTAVSPAGYLTDLLSDAAVDFVHRHRGDPFFLYLAYNAPHTPYQAPAEYLQRFPDVADPECRAYRAMTSAVDDGIGALQTALRELGLEGRTLVALLGDNGGQTIYGCASNAPLRGRKAMLYEGGVRVPFVIHWPGTILPREVDELASSLDLFPTLLDAAGGLEAATGSPDGVSLLSLLAGRSERAPHDVLFWRVSGGAQFAVRRGRWKLIGKGTTRELYDLELDIGETTDRAAEQPELIEELVALWRQWNDGLVEPRWPNPPPEPPGP